MGIEKTSNSGSNWVIAGIPLRAPLKPIYTTGGGVVAAKDDMGLKCGARDDDHGSLSSDDYQPTTPTYDGSRIPAKLPCPPPPRKRKSAPAKRNKKLCNGKKDFFVVPHDLEAVFIRRHVGC